MYYINNIMKIGFYEENTYHTEILGTFIEPFLENSENEFVVYNGLDKSEWVNYYEKIYKFEVKSHFDIIKDLNNLDKIIIGSSSSTSFFLDKLDKGILDSIKNKIFYVTHLKEELNIYESKKTIVLSPLNKSDKNTFILPINNSYKIINKNKDKLIIGVIGRFKNDNRDSDEIINLIINNKDKDFAIYIFSRHIKFIPNKLFEIQKIYPDKLKFFLKKNTEYMVKIFNQIKYLIPLSNKNSIYYKDRLTGIIPLSYNFNIPLVIENNLADIYNINSCIKYNNSIQEVFNTLFTCDYNNLLNNLIIEKNKIILNNNLILQKLFT